MESKGRLIIVPTPIGNLGDITLRALDALKTADSICAEDTRVTGKLLASLGLDKHVQRLDEQVMADRAAQIISRISAGETIAYCSDAGMPGVSDPGMRLISAAHAAKIPVDVLPGPTAVATAFVASGFESTAFFFGGFFLRKSNDRTNLLDNLRTLEACLIFYESPKRLVSALSAIAKAFPHRKIAVCRELTKLHEEVVRDNACEVRDIFALREKGEGIKGEIVIVIEPPTKDEFIDNMEFMQRQATEFALEMVSENESVKDISKKLVSEFGIPRNTAYEIALNATNKTHK